MDTKGYYLDQLSSKRLRQCYEIAPPRVKQYLDAEIRHVLDHIGSSDTVLELGCGYGRVLEKLATKARSVIGIDTSRSSLKLAQEELGGISCCSLFQMDAVALGFRDHCFDAIVCIQNGLSAFKVNVRDLLRESLRVARPGGGLFFSSYSDKFWEDRLEWFRLQADAGLVGEIDWNATREGIIVCKDGFRATTWSPSELLSLASQFDVESRITEVDDSSLFLEIRVLGT